jgi:hypothetical protein
MPLPRTRRSNKAGSAAALVGEDAGFCDEVTADIPKIK